jgi:DNA polymerase-1
MIELGDIAGKEKRIDFISPEIAYLYVASDAVCTMDLYDFFIQQETVKNQKAVYNLEKRVVPVVMTMEANLILIDKPYLETERVRISARIEELKQEIYRIAGKQFNVGSTQQLGKILFNELKYRYPENTKTESGQYKTDTAVLEKIADQYPMVHLIVEFRNLEKSLGTYIENLLNNCDEDGCIKLSFNQNGTDTGRFSSPGGKGIDKDGYSAVNVQAIPANYSKHVPDVRRAFKARPGKKIVAMDFSGEELRVAANLSGESKWINEFLYGEADLHTVTTKSVYKRSAEEKVTPEERSVGKTLNFQILYGAGPRGISEQAHISEIEARRAVANFFEGVPTLAKWMDGERRRARKLKYVKTPFGRIRPLHKFYDSGDRALEAHADRCAVNFLIQGSSADIMKTVMVRVSNWINANNLQDDIKILITMHDELVFEMNETKLEEYIPQLNEIMSLKDILQGILGWPVPLTIDAEYGNTWHVSNNFFEERPELRTSVKPIEFSTPTQVIETLPEPLQVTVETVTPETVAETTPQVSETLPEQDKGSQIEDTTPSIGTPSTESTIPSEVVLTTQPELNSSIEGDYFIYTVKSTTMATLRLLNSIIPFVTEESKKGTYKGTSKILRLVDQEGNMFLVSEFSMNIDAFIALARFFNI